MKKLIFSLAMILMGPAVIAQTTAQQVIVGQPAQVSIKLDSASNPNKCNLQIDIQGQESFEKEVINPGADLLIDLTAQRAGALTVQWKGKTKFRGLNTLSACNGTGTTQVIAGFNNEQVKEKWDRLFSQISPDQVECIKTGFQLLKLKFQSLDPSEIVLDPSDQSVKPIFAKCESFFATKTIWENKNKRSYACTIDNINTACEGVYAERRADGRLREIPIQDAVKLHFDGKPWTTGQRETAEAKTSRIKSEEESKAKQLVADEKQRQWLASPEYKQQQAEIERKRLADEKEATAKAERDKAAVEAQARKEREVQENLAKQRQEQARLDRISQAKRFPYAAILSCSFNGAHTHIEACFAGRVETEIELRNGDAYGLYKAYQLRNLGNPSQEGLIIDLRDRFEIKAQNSADSLILGLKIINRQTNEIAFEKQVAKFGVIRIKN